MTSVDTRETLDDRQADPAAASASLRDIVVINTLFGGRHAARWGVTRLLTGVPQNQAVTVLDLGAGAGDLGDDLRRHLPWRVTPLAFDHLRCAATMSRARGVSTVVADLHAIPLPPRAVDVVLVSQVLHHLPRATVPTFLSTVSSLARIGVVIADLRRSPIARAGIWIASRLLGFHPVTQVDSVTSVEKGFSRMELDHLCRRAGAQPTVRRRPGWRLVAWWRT